MENASTALLMAGGILIGIVILSIMAYLFIDFSSFSNKMYEKMNKTQINSFNANFYNFEGRENITAQEIVTIANFAKEYNTKNELESTDPYYIHVYVMKNPTTGDDLTSKNTDELNEFLTGNLTDNNKQVQFICGEIETNESSQLVNAIHFTKNN